MFKKTAAAYDLAQKFLQKGDARKARLAMDIGDRFEKAAGALERGSRLHPAYVEGDLGATGDNLNLMGDYLKKVQSRVLKIDPNVFSGMGTTGLRSKEALQHLQELQGVLDSVKALYDNQQRTEVAWIKYGARAPKRYRQRGYQERPARRRRRRSNEKLHNAPASQDRTQKGQGVPV